MRAFAVLAVIVNHFNKQILPNGYLGVDIYADGDHISSKWARNFLSPEIYKYIRKITD